MVCRIAQGYGNGIQMFVESTFSLFRVTRLYNVVAFWKENHFG